MSGWRLPTDHFDNSEDAKRALDTVNALWSDVGDELIKAFRWLRLAGRLNRDEEQSLREQVARTDGIVRAVRREIDLIWRAEWP